MSSKVTVEGVSSEAVSELQRAVRSNRHVDIVDAGAETVQLVGERDGLEELNRMLWVRELAAKEYGQSALASADRNARTRLQKAV